MISIDTIGGIANGTISWHYDVFAAVLYLRLLSDMDTPSSGEVTDGGDILLRDEKPNRSIGLSVISWWKRFGHGPLPDSISEIQKSIEPIAKKVAA